LAISLLKIRKERLAQTQETNRETNMEKQKQKRSERRDEQKKKLKCFGNQARIALIIIRKFTHTHTHTNTHTHKHTHLSTPFFLRGRQRLEAKGVGYLSVY